MEAENELCALLPGELESYATTAAPSDIKTLGNNLWIEWHERLQKLQQQAVLEATSNREEITKNTLISNGKIPVLLHEAICISIWRQKILPEILTAEDKTESTFLLYAVLYHENVAVGLLELICFDEEACQNMSELLVDLIDYCIEMITGLIFLYNSGYAEIENDQLDEDIYKELEKQGKNIQYDIGFRCLTIISCLVNHLEKIHVSASSRLYSTHDIPLLLVELLELEPWQRQDKHENLQHFSEGRWKSVHGEDVEKMNRYETLTWISLWKLVLNPHINSHYEMNNYRKSQICKIMYRINEDRMDQLPILMELKRTLGQLSVVDITTQSKKYSTFIEVIPQIKPYILKKIHKKEKTIAKKQLENIFILDKSDLVNIAKKLSVTYTSEVLEKMEDGGPKCANCGEKAEKKCSRCKSEWYCGRECQVKKWGKHKAMCDQFALL